MEMEFDKIVFVVRFDGGWQPKINMGAFASIITYNEGTMVAMGGVKDTTNNRMELTAFLKGVQRAAVIGRQLYPDTPMEILVLGDSKYVTDSFNLNRLRDWFRSNTIDTKKNPELWKEAVETLIYLKKHRIKFSITHVPREENHVADEYCRRVITAGKEGYKVAIVHKGKKTTFKDTFISSSSEVSN